MSVRGSIAVMVLAATITSQAWAQQPAATEPDFPRGHISGEVFGDAYYNMSGNPNHAYNSTGTDSLSANIDGKTVIGKDLNGAQIRRIYFQADNDLSVKYSTRFRLEADGAKTLTTDGKISVNVKAAYLQIKQVAPRVNFLIGVLGTPTWENTENFAQYRAIEKSITDFRALGSAADLGIELKGFADAGHRIGYSIMIGNGNSQKPENNRYKKIYLSLPLSPTSDLRVEPYLDYEGGNGGTEKTTYKLFLGYAFKRLDIGSEILDRVNHSPAGNQEPFGVSVFARAAYPTANVAAFARYDRWQPDTRAANRVDSDLYIAGVDWQVYKDVHLMPNVEATQYRARGTAIAPTHHDMQARLTFFYKFTKP